MTPTATNDEKYCCYRDSVLKGDFVNHELSENLDSTNAFEGPEKLLEIWFAPSGSCLPISWPKRGLRDIPLSGIEHMLSEVNCEIISRVSSQMMDAYLLSESSLFVFCT
ncbi:s-adenosylmethionine decarboxylase [Brettanomyces bruxellensis AWRI1499]|nr:s-adenosylmethionine decarboxylase [Brettanomyces bruxellensis AWRI1499]